MMMGIGWSISGPRRRRSRMPAPAPAESAPSEAVDVAEESMASIRLQVRAETDDVGSQTLQKSWPPRNSCPLYPLPLSGSRYARLGVA